MTAETKAQIAKRIVRNEVHLCLSGLVATLAQSGDSRLGDIYEQAVELAAPIPDYESAAREAGWKTVYHARRGWLAVRDSDDGTDADIHDYCGTQWTAFLFVCERHEIEPHDREVFEHWAISNWLADKLEAKGEKVDRDFAGLIVWARTTTGQSIAIDAVIEEIAADLARGA